MISQFVQNALRLLVLVGQGHAGCVRKASEHYHTCDVLPVSAVFEPQSIVEQQCKFALSLTKCL